MKKVILILVPVVLVIAVTGFYAGRGEESSSSCMLSPKEYMEAEKSEAIIIDVRTPREYESGHLENAIMIDISSRSFRDKIAQLDKSKQYIVYCKTGIRSRSAVNYMVNAGFKHVCDLQGGINYLTRAGVKLVR
jgi:rhodanese-related sulfurtransferase